MEVRRARQEDVPRIMELLAQVLGVHHEGRPDLFKAEGSKYSAEELSGIVVDDARPTFVAVDDAEGVVGHAFCQFEQFVGSGSRTDALTLYVDDICVDEAMRGRHVGTALYDHVVAFARDKGCHNVTLNVWSCNPGALKFYEAMGMRPYRVGMEAIL